MTTSVILQLKVKRNTDLFGTIIIRAYLNRRPVISKSTGHRINKDHWDAQNRRVLDHAPNANLLNTIIQQQLQDIQGDLLKKQIMGAKLNKQIIIESVKGQQQGLDFYAFCLRRIKADYTSTETIRVLEGQVGKLKEFRPLLSFSDIDFHFLTAYKKYMEDRGNKNNTIWSGLKFLNTMLNKAIKEGGIIKSNPFADFDRGKYIQVNKTPLSIEDCTAIEKLIDDPLVKRKVVKAVAVRFLLMAYSGMRFADAMRFDPTLHVKDGRLIMNYNKWSEKVDYRLYNRLQNIINLIPDYPLKISNTHFNNYLQVIQGLAKIDVHITSHIGRHTMGYFLSDKNVPISKAQKILGHKDEKSTRIYYHVTDEQVDRAVSQLNDL